ncbi:hypothetical protein PIB30_061829 [Stylosanthes scabra]|uniref:Transposase MuDR plant domain-containing protein n=1 Tax=Stylosanthes scabra TaxID=79078 RepID=A0ABU6QLY6_9FABA|nr:hypothetical protein [Stylosanthes scabra]
MSRSNLIVGTLYPDGEMIRQEDGIEFVCPNPILCYIERVDMLDELKNFILRTMGALRRKSVRRVAYKLLNILPLLEYKFKIFWLKGDVHVRAMFDLHRRYGPRQVMELLFETRDMIRSEAGPLCARAAPVGPIAAATLRIATPDVSVDMDSSSGEGSDGEYLGETDESSDSFNKADFVDETQVGQRVLLPAPAAIPDLASVSSHFHTLNLDAMEEEPREGQDGGEEFRVRHRFSCKEAVQMAVKNYNIRSAVDYRVLESDPYKYVCRCKQHESRCPWRGSPEVRGATFLHCPFDVSRPRAAGQQPDL